MYRFYNPNPSGIFTDDCIVRATCKVLDISWEAAYMGICLKGLDLHNMPDKNVVWDKYLLENGMKMYAVTNHCPQCYTVMDFCRDHPIGKFIIGTGSHVVAIVNGDYYDTWDSGYEVPVFYWKGEDR